MLDLDMRLPVFTHLLQREAACNHFHIYVTHSHIYVTVAQLSELLLMATRIAYEWDPRLEFEDNIKRHYHRVITPMGDDGKNRP